LCRKALPGVAVTAVFDEASAQLGFGIGLVV
jgi:hypothetical protein